MNVTPNPHQTWTAQQVVEAVGFDTGINRLIRDRDKIYGTAFDWRVTHLGIRQLKTAPRSRRPGRTDMRSGSSVRYGVRYSTMSLSSASATCCD